MLGGALPTLAVVAAFRSRRDEELDFDAMASAVTAGLGEAKKRRKEQDEAARAERLAAKPVAAPVDAGGAGGAAGPAAATAAAAASTEGWLCVLAGDAELPGGGVVFGRGEFASALVAGATLGAGKWYYEAHVLTPGLAQVGGICGGYLVFRCVVVAGQGVGWSARGRAAAACANHSLAWGRARVSAGRALLAQQPPPPTPPHTRWAGPTRFSRPTAPLATASGTTRTLGPSTGRGSSGGRAARARRTARRGPRATWWAACWTWTRASAGGPSTAPTWAQASGGCPGRRRPRPLGSAPPSRSRPGRRSGSE